MALTQVSTIMPYELKLPLHTVWIQFSFFVYVSLILFTAKAMESAGAHNCCHKPRTQSTSKEAVYVRVHHSPHELPPFYSKESQLS